MKLVYITAQLPYGRGEQFVLPEMLGLLKKGHQIRIIPIRPEKKLGEGEEQKKVAPYTDTTSLFSLKVFFIMLYQIILHPIKFFKIIYILFKHSCGLNKAIKNLVIVPKAFYIAHVCKKENIDHIHVHWASTSATAGYIASMITGIEWSFTAHRWDIYENNMIKEKFRTAKFVRVINRKGYNDIIKYANKEDINKCNIIHVGINIDNIEERDLNKNDEGFNIAVPANLIEVKGHKYFIEAIKILKLKGIKPRCYFYGQGYLREELEAMINSLNLEEEIELCGQIAHDKLIDLYKTGAISTVILPSINTDAGEHEGIPVSLMEAMANKVPVISTNTGGIPELLENNSGIIVEEKNPEQLAEAIEKLISDTVLRNKLIELGFKKVNDEFNNDEVVNSLAKLFDENTVLE